MTIPFTLTFYYFSVKRNSTMFKMAIVISLLNIITDFIQDHLHHYHHHQSLNQFNCQRDLKVDETKNRLQEDLLLVALRSYGIFMSLQSFMLSGEFLHCAHRLWAPSTVSCIIFLQRLLCIVTSPDHGIFRCSR